MQLTHHLPTNVDDPQVSRDRMMVSLANVFVVPDCAMALSSDKLLGELIRRFRLTAAISQDELAERSGVSVRTISDLERGIRHTARLETVRMLADGLDLHTDDRASLIESVLNIGPKRNEREHGRRTQTFTDLPTQPNRLIGRDQLVETIVDAVTRESRSLVTLTGPGGVGKTRVAIEAARVLADADNLPAVFVPLVMVRAVDLVPAAIADALGLPANSGDPLQRIVKLLRQRRFIVLLDNFEHLIDAAPLVADIHYSVPDIVLIVTSRARLRLSGERDISVGPLDLPGIKAPLDQVIGTAAVQLFVDRSGLDSLSDDHARDVADICRQLDGLPLAIELAASKVRVMSIPMLRELMAQRLPLLSGGLRDQPQHQQSLRETIRWSHELLQTEEQSLFRYLSIYVGGFSVEAVLFSGEALGITQLAVFEALENLIDSGLILVRPVDEARRRFRILETIREFGHEQLLLRNEMEAARSAHAAFLLQSLRVGSPPPFGTTDPDWIARIEPDAANSLAAFEWLCGSNADARCADFSAAIGGFWANKGPLREQAARMRAVRHLFKLGGDESELNAQFWTTVLSMYGGDYDEARVLSDEGLARARVLGNLYGEACFLHCLGWHRELAYALDESDQFFEEASRIWETLGETSALGQIRMLTGGHAFARGDIVRAKDLVTSAQSLFAELGDVNFLGATLWYLGFFAAAEGDLRTASSLFLQALEHWLSARTKASMFKATVYLSDIAATLGDFETAATLIGVSQHLMSLREETLFPLDLPAWERATSGSREALGVVRYNELCAGASELDSVDWLGLATKVVELAEQTEPQGADDLRQSSAVVIPLPARHIA